MAKMETEILKMALVATVLVGVLALAAVVLLGKGRRRAERLAPAFELGTAKPTGFLANSISGLYRGFSCRYLVQYASQYDRGGATLRLSVESPHQWSAEVERPGARMLTKFGLLEDFEIGHRDLDDHLRFAGPDEGVLRSLFGMDKVLDQMHILAASENF